jgi:hypothetical protein
VPSGIETGREKKKTGKTGKIWRIPQTEAEGTGEFGVLFISLY